ncbi:MAG: hypothetical protein GY724_06250 [Actinomycetia bacterium]|nr:hypothetical protein [Actinomycetes bacterium]
MALMVAISLATMGCTNGANASDGPAASMDRLSKLDTQESASPAPDDTAPADNGPGSALAAQLKASESGRTEGESSTREGTDSEVIVPPSLDPELESKLALFGQAYLAYDYRVTGDSRLAPIKLLVTQDLYDGLVAPLPAALVETLIAQRRIVTAEFLAVEGIESSPSGGGIYQLSFMVTETSTAPLSDEASIEERTQLLTVVLGPDELIEDVR